MLQKSHSEINRVAFHNYWHSKSSYLMRKCGLAIFPTALANLKAGKFRLNKLDREYALALQNVDRCSQIRFAAPVRNRAHTHTIHNDDRRLAVVAARKF